MTHLSETSRPEVTNGSDTAQPGRINPTAMAIRTQPANSRFDPRRGKDGNQSESLAPERPIDKGTSPAS